VTAIERFEFFLLALQALVGPAWVLITVGKSDTLKNADLSPRAKAKCNANHSMVLPGAPLIALKIESFLD